jgi:hypothetical protein
MQIKLLVDQIIIDRVLTKAEQEEFTHHVMLDGQISAEEKAQIERLTAMIERGEIRVVD